MTTLGFVLLVLGIVLMVVEAHVPGGVFGAVGGAALVAGTWVVIGALGAGVAIAAPIGVGIGAAAGGWTLLAVRKGAATQRLRVRSGAEGLPGRMGVVRGWSDPTGQVFVDGALWRARCEWPEPDAGPLSVGDQVVVERVSGLTLSVRRAEEWEVIG
jgi:membrane-bound serine protease (ClpP class)